MEQVTGIERRKSNVWVGNGFAIFLAQKAANKNGHGSSKPSLDLFHPVTILPDCLSIS
jgi:hypothetical protein